MESAMGLILCHFVLRHAFYQSQQLHNVHHGATTLCPALLIHGGHVMASV